MGARHVGLVPRVAALTLAQQSAAGDGRNLVPWRREGYTIYGGDAGAGVHLVVGFFNTQRDIPTVAGKLRLYGTSDDVDPSGIGYRTVRVTGLDADYVLQSEVVALAGATPVYTTGLYIRVFDVEALTAGSDTSGSSVPCKSEDAVDFFQYLYGGQFITMDAAWCVPAGKKLVVTKWGVLTRDDAVVSFRLETRAFGRTFFTPYSRIQAYRNAPERDLWTPLVLEEKDDIQIVANSSSANHEIGAYMEGWYQDA